MKSLQNKVAVVTGASSGIGQAIAEHFAMSGASLVLAGRHADKLNAVAQSIEARRGKAHVVVCDVSVEQDVVHLMAEAQRRFNGLDLLVNSAGIMRLGPIAETELADYHSVIDTNLKGTYLGCREAFKVMRARGGGTILNIASIAGKDAWAETGLYAASKFAVVGLTRALADEGVAHQIRVSAICPAAVNTPMHQGSGLGASELIQPEDVAAAAFYLATLPRNVVIKELLLERRGADG